MQESKTGGENMQQSVTCPNCGNQNTANQQFCVSCGAHLGSAPRTMPHIPIVTGVAAPTQVVTPIITPAPQAQKPVEVKPTWGLAWGLFWRMLFLWVFLLGICFLGYMIVRLAQGFTTVFGLW
jgi:hypothetical protein